MTSSISHRARPHLHVVADDAAEPTMLDVVRQILATPQPGAEICVTIHITLAGAESTTVDDVTPLGEHGSPTVDTVADLPRRSTPPTALSGVDDLPSRQREILALASRGLTNTEIASALFLSVSTVERHCTIAYRALGVRNRAEALSLLKLDHPTGAHAGIG